jgi:hypothetical protein
MDFFVTVSSSPTCRWWRVNARHPKTFLWTGYSTHNKKLVFSQMW